MTGVKMIVLYILLLAFICSISNGQGTNKEFERETAWLESQVGKMSAEEIEKKIQKYDKEQLSLNNEANELKGKILHLRATCPKEIHDLKQKFEMMMKHVEENQKILHKLLKKIQEEEAEHIRLEAELKRVSEVLELLQFQYEILKQDLGLAQKRQTNNMAKNCQELMQELALITRDDVKARSMFKGTSYKVRQKKTGEAIRKMIVLKTKIKLLLLLKQKLQKTRDEMLQLYQLERDTCNVKKENIITIIDTTQYALNTSAKSIELLTANLKDAIDFSNAIRLEIKTAIEFLRELDASVDKLKGLIVSFRSDYECYAQIKKMD